ncbi:hypothetical protein NHQ30_006615 [Ciborinia camelliae]|nr:hypothetical protein NHQ30_006615 [Ciborinia camelliae]
MVNTTSTLCDDGGFGPTVIGCRGDFDFTLLFEQSFLSIAPSSLFFFLCITRLIHLLIFRRKRQVAGFHLQQSKLVAIALYGTVQCVLVALWTKPGAYGTRTSLVAAILSLIDIIPLAIMSWVEHGYSRRPSALTSIYLLLSILFDAVETRTLWLKNAGTAIPALFTTSLVLKTGILALETVEKDSYLFPELGKNLSPEETSGVFNQSILLWLRGILSEGRKRIIFPKDLYVLAPELKTERLSEAFWEAWASKMGSRSSQTIIFVLLRSLGWSFFLPVIPRLVQTSLTICQPLLLSELLQYLQGEGGFVNGKGYGFIGAYGLVYFGIAISTCFYWRLTYKCLVQVRGCLVAAIYKKTTYIDVAQYDMTAPVSLMSADIERILQGCKDVHEIWANMLQVAIAVWLLYRELGVACVAPAVVAILSSIGSVLMSSYANSSQVKWMEATQERVGATVKAIASMKGVRLLGLSGSIHAVLAGLRRSELHAARYFRYIEVLTASVSFAPLLLSPVFTFLVFVLQARGSGAILDATKIFTSLSLLQLMTQPLVWLFQAIPLLFASLGCLGRIGSYLQAPPKTECRLLSLETGSQGPSSTTVKSMYDFQKEKSVEAGTALSIRNGEFGWSTENLVLREVNVDIPASKLTMIVGPVASGKSTLMRAIIGELPCSKGEIQIKTPRCSSIAYCADNPFLINASLQQNIVGFSDFDEAWYDTVMRAVDLKKVLSSFSGGNQTRIGSKGVSLSGGQRQRVAIARAVYARKSLAVFDDVLSGLDITTKQHVFENVFSARGLLCRMGTTVILGTHDIDLLPNADHIIALSENGSVADSGTFEVLNRSSAYIMSLAVHDRPVEHGTKAMEQEKVQVTAELSLEEELPVHETAEDLTRRLGDPSIYRYLFSRIGAWKMLLFTVFQCGWAVTSTIGPVWLQFWATDNASASKDNHNAYYLGVYAAFQILALAFLALFAGFTLTTIAVKIGTSLHGVLLSTVMAAPLSFFSTTDTGITTNRFSQDLLLIDGELPTALLETVSAGFVAIVQLILIARATPYVAISYPFLVYLLYYIQSFYLRTSRQLRLLDLEAKSPLYTHFIETLNGLSTIRSFNWLQSSIEHNHQLVDESQKPLYLLYMVQRWLQLVLELLIAATSVILVAVAVKLQSTSTGSIGVALLNLMSISQELKMIVINWTALETSLGAVSRIQKFQENTPPEDKPGEENHPPEGWPENGNVEFNNVSATYNQTGAPVLKNVFISIPTGHKVAIVGRSGSGKSSLLLALARMIDLESGFITISNIGISTIPRSVVRSTLNFIPQEPYFFHKMVSKNLDPRGMATEEDMRAALESVGLWHTVERAGGLRGELNDEILSQGQKQLFALARAMVNRSKIVVLDEATSNVDQTASTLMQKILREHANFQGKTIITVAHQLDTIMDYDHIVVLDRGEVVESGAPGELLACGDSVFGGMCRLHGVEY